MGRIYEDHVCSVLWSSRFCLRFAVRTTLGGAVLFFVGGVALAIESTCPLVVRVVGAVDALIIACSFLWSTLYWDTPVAIEVFLSESRGHALSHASARPACLLTTAALINVLCAIAYAYAIYQSEIDGRTDVKYETLKVIERVYLAAATSWHIACAILFSFAALLQFNARGNPQHAPMLSPANSSTAQSTTCAPPVAGAAALHHNTGRVSNPVMSVQGPPPRRMAPTVGLGVRLSAGISLSSP